MTLPSHFPKTDNKWHDTRLYRNQQGAYFLAGEGGTLSRWAKATPRGAIPGEGIVKLSEFGQRLGHTRIHNSLIVQHHVPGLRQTISPI